MTVHLCLKLGNMADHLRHRCFVTFGKLFHTLREGLADAIHLAMDGGITAQ